MQRNGYARWTSTGVARKPTTWREDQRGLLRVSEPEQPPPWQPSYQHAPPGQPYFGYPVAPPPNPYAYAPASRYTYAPPSHRGGNVIIGSIVATLVIVVAVVEVTGSQSPTAHVSAVKGTTITHSTVAPAASNPPNPPNPGGGITASSPLNSPVGKTVIFSDYFNDPNSGWDTGADDDSTYTYTSSGYAMTTAAPAIFFSYAPDDTPAQQVSLSVTAVEAPGSDPDAGYGASCRRGPDSASQLRYEFRITGSGEWFIERNQGDLSSQTPTVLAQGPTRLLAGWGATVSAVCATLADCTTTRLALFLNGTKVADTTDVATADGAGWLGAIMSTNPAPPPRRRLCSTTPTPPSGRFRSSRRIPSSCSRRTV
jgi:hypothetical protein